MAHRKLKKRYSYCYNEKDIELRRVKWLYRFYTDKEGKTITQYYLYNVTRPRWITINVDSCWFLRSEILTKEQVITTYPRAIRNHGA